MFEPVWLVVLGSFAVSIVVAVIIGALINAGVVILVKRMGRQR
jgi:hypothetical protein